MYLAAQFSTRSVTMKLKIVTCIMPVRTLKQIEGKCIMFVIILFISLFLFGFNFIYILLFFKKNTSSKREIFTIILSIFQFLFAFDFRRSPKN